MRCLFRFVMFYVMLCYVLIMAIDDWYDETKVVERMRMGSYLYIYSMTFLLLLYAFFVLFSLRMLSRHTALEILNLKCFCFSLILVFTTTVRTMSLSTRKEKRGQENPEQQHKHKQNTKYTVNQIFLCHKNVSEKS